MLVAFTRRRATTLFVILFTLSTSVLSGCGSFSANRPSGELSISSRLDSKMLAEHGFDNALYNYDGQNNITVVAYSGSADEPTHAAVIRMFWRPRAGRTPIDRDATNATMHYVIFNGENDRGVDIYSGAGFVYPKQKPGGETLNLGVWQADLRLGENELTEDMLGPAQLEGWITAARDDAGTEKMIRRINHRIRDLTGTVRMVGRPTRSSSQPQS